LSNHLRKISPAVIYKLQAICVLRATKPFNTHSGSNMSDKSTEDQ